jgi:IS5 family transposase
MGSFFGTYLFEQIVPSDHFMRALKELFDWDALGHELIALYAGKGLVGRPPYDPTLMFKMLFLSFLYDLSERDTQRFVDENIPARYFLDLALDQLAPDHSTLSIFKGRLLANGSWAHLQRIYDGLLLQAMDHGLEFGHVQIVDATHTRDHVNHEKDKKRQEKGKPPRDPDSRVVRKGKREVVEPDGTKVKKDIRYRGYKTHTSVNAKTGVASSLLPSHGSMADNKAFPYLHTHDRSLGLPTTIYAGDKAYDDTDIFERIEQAGMHVGISLRRFRTAKADPNKERWERLKETPEYQEGKALRYRVEQPYGQAKDKHGLERCRYLGLLKYGVQSYLTFMVVTVKRLVKLLTGITFRELAKGSRREVFQPVYDTPPWV